MLVMNLDELERMSVMGFEDVKGQELLAFGELKPAASDVPEVRIRRVLETGKNPYFRRSSMISGGMVKISFANNGVSMSDALAGALANL